MLNNSKSESLEGRLGYLWYVTLIATCIFK